MAAAGVRLSGELAAWLERARVALERHSAELEARGLCDWALAAGFRSSGTRAVHDAFDRLTWAVVDDEGVAP